MKQMLQDLGYALRTFRRAPGFAAVTILTLALGIGATTAVFSVVYGLLANPYPYLGAARMIHLGKITETIDEARDVAQRRLLDGSGYKKLKEVIQAQGGNPNVLDRFDLLPNASGAREIASPRAGFVSQIKAEDIGQASQMIGAGRDTKEDSIDPAVGVILEVKVGEKVEAGAVLCRLYYTKDERLEEAAQLVEDAFRISAHPPDERELILETVG